MTFSIKWVMLLALTLPLTLAAQTQSPEVLTLPAPLVKDHHGTFNGKSLSYRSVVEAFTLTPLPDNPLTLISSSYLVGNNPQRPVLFAFNGGPISPSVYLHMLALGPKRLAIPDDLHADPASFQLTDNPDSPLDKADLVFYDPAGTGYSHFDAPAKSAEYFGNTNDAKAFVAFMHAWLQRHQRSSSPVYILGESYGTMRAAAVAQQLSAEAQPVDLKGIYLFGQALNIVETAQRPANIMTYVVSLKTLAALAWYHGKVAHNGRSFKAFMDEVGQFAEGDYLKVLLAGNRASAAENQAVADRLAALTGVSAKVQLQYHLRMSKNQFRVELLKADNLILGASDGRYTAKPERAGDVPDGSATIYPAIFNAFASYKQSMLGINSDAPYVVSSPVSSLAQWDWGSKAGPFGNWPYAEGISAALTHFPAMQLVLGVGYYDTLTTTGATEYLLQQNDWPASRVHLHYYAGGHMAYTVAANLQQFSTDLRQWLSK